MKDFRSASGSTRIGAPESEVGAVPQPDPVPPAAGPGADDARLGEALDWLILLDSADAECRARFEAWMAASPDNALAFRLAQSLWQSPLLTAAAARLDREHKRPVRRTLLKPLAAAAVLLLAVGVGLQSDLLLRLRADHLTEVGQRQNLELADGSRILLNTDTALSSRIDDQQRSARLYQGEAYFDVAHDRSRPFEVDAGPVQVSVRGTAFAVRYLGDEAEVSVERGEVDLRSREDNARVSLSAGDSIRIGPAGFGDRRHGQADQLAWVKGRLVFEDCPMREVLAELRRYYPGWIISTDERLGERTVTGNYRLDDPLGVVRSLAHITSTKLHEFPALVILD